MTIADECVYTLLDMYSTLLPHEIDSLTFEQAKQHAMDLYLSVEADQEKELALQS
jgi:hypothetical protein